MNNLSRTRKAWPVIFLLITLAMGTPMVMAIDEVVDDYEDEGRVDVKVNIIRNVTLDCMELNYTSGVGGPRLLEDFTTYTQVEEGNEIDVQNSTYVEFFDDRRKTSYLYYDYGVDYFGDFTHFIDIYRDAHQASSFLCHWMISNYLGGEKAHRDTLSDHLFVVVSGSNPNLRLYEYDSGNWYSSASFTITKDVWYYLNITKNGVDMYLNVYSTYALREIGGNGDILSTGLTLQNDYKMRYIYAGNTYDDGGNFVGESHLRNYWYGKLSGGYETDGYFTTTNFLDGLSDNATVLLTSTTIPSGSINAQISNDGVAWTDLGVLDVGYGAIDLRTLGFINSTLMFNYTRGDPSETPRLFQVRLVHEGNATVGPGPGVATPVDETPFIAIGIILAMAMVLIADRARK